jgi:transposase
MPLVVGLDLHLRQSYGTVMEESGRIVKQGKFETSKERLAEFLKDVPGGTRVALEAQGFCWPWIDYLEELGYRPLLVNPMKAKQRAEDLKTDKVDSEILAHLTRMNWLPTVYVPPREIRDLKNLLRHRFYLRMVSTALKNRTWSEFRKRDLPFDFDLGTKKGRRFAREMGTWEIQQNVEVLELLEEKMSAVELSLAARYGDLEPVRLLRTIPGIGVLTALGVYAEIGDIRRFPNSDRLAHYAGLVPRVSQSGGQIWHGRETKGNKWLKWLLIEAAWMHLRHNPNGRLAKVYQQAVRRKGKGRKAIKVVARKLVNIVWEVWTKGEPFRE